MKTNQHSKYYIRFVLEVIVLIASGWWVFTRFSGWLAVLASAITVLSLMLVWGIFNVPNDPSRSGKAPVVVSGRIRLALEIIVFLFGTFAIMQWQFWLGILFGIAVIAHYIHIKDRIKWLLEH